MSKYRCSRCGATHRNEATQCRLCGMDLTGEHIPLYQKPRQQKQKKRGIGTLAAWGALGVLAIAAIALALGLTKDDANVREAAKEVPLVDLSGPDGWQPVEDPDGGIVFDMPGTATLTEVPFTAASDGEASVWTSEILDETEIRVLYADVPAAAEGDTDRLRLEAMAEAWAAHNGTTVRDSDVTTFRGSPAIDVELDRWSDSGDPRPGKAFIVLRDDRVYVVQVHSIYPALTQYPRVVESLDFT